MVCGISFEKARRGQLPPSRFFFFSDTKHFIQQKLCKQDLFRCRRKIYFRLSSSFYTPTQEIFLRELVSNAVDATTKLKAIAARGEMDTELGDTHIEILLDAEAKTLTIRDRGIGMSADEVNRYLNQVAFSSAQEFFREI
jgi:hypothetical protein